MHFAVSGMLSRCVFLECLGVSGCVHVYMFISGYFCMYLGMHMYTGVWYTTGSLCLCHSCAYMEEGGAALGCLVSCK